MSNAFAPIDDLTSLPEGEDDYTSADEFSFGELHADDDEEQLQDDTEEVAGEEDVPAKRSRSKTPAKSGFHLTQTDLTIIRFLTRYSLAYSKTIAYLVNRSRQSTDQRLLKLLRAGLLRRFVIAPGATLWTPTRDGIGLVGYAYEPILDVKFATVQHTINLANIAAELEREEGSDRNVLALPDWGASNRFPDGENLFGVYDATDDGPMQRGEQTVTEREIRSFQRLNKALGVTSEEQYELVRKAVTDSSAPELLPGNEALWVVYGTAESGRRGQKNEHVPDLVVPRLRDPHTGRPRSIAVELELTLKGHEDLKRILRTYRDAGQLYERVVYFTPRKQIANALNKVNEQFSILPPEKLLIRKWTPQTGNLFLG